MKKIVIIMILILVSTGSSYAQTSLRAEKETIKIETSGNAKFKKFTPYIEIAKRELSKRFIVKSSGDTDNTLTIYLY